LIPVGVCYKQRASQVILKGPQETEITMRTIATLGRLVHNLPALAP